ncbi:MAG: hypothetical protein U1E26_12300 [Coriobacteriia bacterium]|nr:hypothetical protein [Coriobacteriia bacterium]
MSDLEHAAERAELERIDFLLNELARAVERGEVHRASYDLMAPRYLERRAEIVAALTGVPRVARGAPVSGDTPGVAGMKATGTLHPVATRTKPAPKPVDWTTVLLFLGAFLVIVASAIFSVAAWGLLDTAAKFGFMAALTVGFYVAGWWARTRLKLVVGSTALTVVASAMLLLDGWILIDGYDLSGPWPWAVLLLICSVAYWYTEARIASRFFGVIGAAAQIAWWWLLGAGLGLPEPARLAGLAVVALLWQVAAERGKGRAAVGSLATVLRWAAPILSAGAGVGLLVDLALVGTADALTVASAAVVSAAGGVVLWRALQGQRVAGSIAATAIQLPLFVSCVAAADSGHAWWIVAVLALAAVANDLLGLSGKGIAFSIVGLVAEAAAVLEACLVLEASPTTTIVVMAGLAALWSLAARLLSDQEGQTPALRGATDTATSCDVAAFVLLVLASAALPVVTLSLPVPWFDISRTEVLAYVGVLAAWWASVTIRPSAVSAFAGAVFSFAALAAVETWSWPTPSAALFALPLVGLAGVWLASGRVLEPRYGVVWGVVTRVSARAALAVLVLVPAVLPAHEPQRVGPWGGPWDPVVLAALAAAILLADGIMSRSRASAVMAGPVAVFGGWLVGPAVVAGSGVTVDHSFGSLIAASVGVALAGGAFAVRRSRAGSVGAWIAVSATVAASAAVLLMLADGESGRVLALSALLVAGAWCFSGALSTQWLTGGAGGALIVGSMALTTTASEWSVVAAFGVLGLALVGLSFVRGFGRTGRLAHVGAAQAVAGVGALGVAVMMLESGTHPHAVAVLLLAVGGLTASVARRFEPGYYAAGFTFVVAIWLETSIVGDFRAPAALYALPLAAYLMASGYLYVRLKAGRAFPDALDAAAVLVGVGYPLVIALQSAPDRALADSLAAVVMALIALGAGIGLKVRWYLFGGAAGLASIALYRSFSAIAEYWWLVLGLIGIAMLVIALTWQRQRIVVTEARESLRRSFEGWR